MPKSKQHINERRRTWLRKIRIEVINHYSDGTNACAECNFGDMRALVIDHFNDDGAEHRKYLGSKNICILLRKNGFPPGFQVLCANCNMIKEYARRMDLFIN